MCDSVTSRLVSGALRDLGLTYDLLNTHLDKGGRKAVMNSDVGLDRIGLIVREKVPVSNTGHRCRGLRIVLWTVYP